MSFTKDLSSYLTTYGTYTIGVKAHAEGFRDSDTATTSYTNLPILTYVDETELTFTNVMLGVSEIKLYVDNTLVDTISHDPTDDDDVTIDLTSYNLNSDSHEFYIIVTAPDKTGTTSTFTSETIVSAMILGVSGLYNQSPTLTRTDDAIGATWVNSNGTITSDLDNKFPFNAIQTVTLESGDIMVEIPSMYWRIGCDSSNRLTDVAVSNRQVGNGDWYHTPAFQIGKYLTNSSGYSKSGQTPGTSANFTANITSIKNKGMYYETLYHYVILEMLFWIYFATKDSQSVFITTGNSALKPTGDTDSNNSMNCIVSNRFKFLGIEDFIGNQYRMVAGTYANYFFDVYNNQSAIMSSAERSMVGKINLNYTTLNNGSSYRSVKALGWDSSHPFICVPMEEYGVDYSKYFCDGTASISWRDQNNVPYLGQYYADASSSANLGGLHCWAYSPWSSSSAVCGCRLVKFLS